MPGNREIARRSDTDQHPITATTVREDTRRHTARQETLTPLQKMIGSYGSAMKFRTLLLIPTLMHGSVLADGIPVNDDRTRCRVPHQLINTNDDQLEELTVAGTLTLTREQWTQLRAINPAVPKRIDSIVPCTYNDCACCIGESNDGSGHYGIWFKNGTVAIVLDTPPTPFHEWTAERKKNLCSQINLRVDERGQFYENGRLIPYAEAKARTAWVPEQKTGNLALSIELPPHLDAKAPALAARIAELQAIAGSAGRDFWVLWTTIQP